MADVTLRPPAGAAATPASRTRPALTALAVVAAGVLAVASGSNLGEGTKAAVVLPLAAGVGACLASLAASRFAVYVLIMLALRSSIDLAKLSGSSAGIAGSAAERALDPSSLFAALFLASAALWLAGEYRRTGLAGSRLRIALVCLLGAGLASATGSANPTASLLELMRMAAAVTMFVVLEQLARRPGGIRHILGAVYVSAVFPLLLTATTFLAGSPRTEQKGQLERTVGSFNQSNEFGRYLMVLLIMGVALYPHVERRWRGLLAMALGGASVFLFLTYTRSAMIGTVVGLLVVGWLQNKRVVIGLLMLVAMSLIVVPGFATRFSVLGDDDARAGEGNSLAWRFEYWGDVLPLAEKNPLTGIGLVQTQYQTDEAKQPHNDFLRAYVETGVLGLAAYVGVIAALIGLGRRALRRTIAGTFERGAAVGFMGAVAAFVAVSTVANVISNVVVLWYFFAYAAVASALARGAPAHESGARAP